MALTYKQIKAKSNIDRLSAELDKINPSKKKSYEKDARFWFPERDKSGSAHALIRFLPAPGDEDVPIIRYFHHAFQGPTKAWYIENSLMTFDKPDPVAEYNSMLWNTGDEEKQAIARRQKRKLQFVSNILVIQDKANPSNNGKVFLFKYGKKIFEKVNAMMFPEFEGVDKVDPFDVEKGANFRLSMKTVDGFPNYDASGFDAPAPISLNGKKLSEKEIEAVFGQLHSLQELMGPKYFKTYDELKARLEKVLGLTDEPRVLSQAPRRGPSMTSAAMDIDTTPKPTKKEDIDLSFLEDGDDD